MKIKYFTLLFFHLFVAGSLVSCDAFEITHPPAKPTSAQQTIPPNHQSANQSATVSIPILVAGAGQTAPTQGAHPPQGTQGRPGEIQVTQRNSTYAIAKATPSGRFSTGQNADMMLSGIDFNNTGGALLFNHPTGIASDGNRLLMTDRFNNRVLIWNTLPSRNVAPDLVLGQQNFVTNNPGIGRNQLNWPGNITVAPNGTMVAVTDTNNDRILIWRSFPTQNGASADIVIDLVKLSSPSNPQRLGWPWGVWTDGTKFAVVATHGKAVLIWNQIPTQDNQPPDLTLLPSQAGTLRNITSNGQFFAVSDHNYGTQSRPATQFWLTFPTSTNQAADFVIDEWLKGEVLANGKLGMAGLRSLYLWDQLPRSANDKPALTLTPSGYRNGDGPDMLVAGGRLYAVNYNGNNILVWDSLPKQANQPPDWSLGSDTPATDTLADNFFITNPVPATDGKRLFVSSDFDRKLHVWRNLPDQSNAQPDVTYSFPDAPWDNALYGQTLVLAGKHSVYIWKNLPLNGELPDIILNNRIGNITLQELTGVTLDDRYFYLSDRSANKVYIWQGVPNSDQNPLYTLNINRPGMLSSDGQYLAVAPFEGATIQVYRVANLSDNATATQLGSPGQFNLPKKCVVSKGALIISDTSFNRVQIWHRIADALSGKPADAILGANDTKDITPEIGRDKLFMPGTAAYDGSYLWVGEFKFSMRLLRYSLQ
jgi:hypothetical protein